MLKLRHYWDYIFNYVIDYIFMGMRKQGEQNIRKLTKLGGKSLAVTLPIDMVAKLGWREKQKVRVIAKGKHLIIRDWEK